LISDLSFVLLGQPTRFSLPGPICPTWNHLWARPRSALFYGRQIRMKSKSWIFDTWSHFLSVWMKSFSVPSGFRCYYLLLSSWGYNII
jgi:hypothetical protein